MRLFVTVMVLSAYRELWPDGEINWLGAGLGIIVAVQLDLLDLLARYREDSKGRRP